jgi:hypothetical protein
MIDVEVTSLTKKSTLRGKGRPIHLAEGPLTAVRANMEGNTVDELRAVQTDHTWNTHVIAPICAVQQDK